VTRRSWTDGPMVSWDTETTGSDPETARIVTTATVAIRPGAPVAPTEWLVDPGVEIPAEATAVHGITTEHARAHGAKAEAAVAALVAHLLAEAMQGVPLVIYNAKYDLTVLDRECRRYGLETLTDECWSHGVDLFVIDPFVIDRAVDKYRRGKRTLAATAAHYGIELSETEAHTASGDCLAAARIAGKIGRAYSEVGTLSLGQLQKFQARAHAEWAENFERYLRTKKNEPDAVISRDWPIIPAEVSS